MIMTMRRITIGVAMLLLLLGASAVATYSEAQTVSAGSGRRAEAAGRAAKARAEAAARNKAAEEKARADAEARAKAEAAAIVDPAALKAEAMTLAPTLTTALKLSCTPTDARPIAELEETAADGAKTRIHVMEVACQEGMGYILAASPDGKGAADDCLIAATSTDEATRCTLPGNANPAAGLQSRLAKAGSGCVVDQGKVKGQTPALTVYEVKCQNGAGVLALAARPQTPDSAFNVLPCIRAAEANIKCDMTTDEANAAPIRAMATRATPPCTVNNMRFVASMTTGDFYEFACSSGNGIMVQVDAKGDMVRTLTCAQAIQVQGGCTLSSATIQGATEDNAIYTRQAKAAGFNCDVSKYYVSPISGSGREIVEMACSNRPDGAVGVFSSGPPEILNCARSQAESVKCNFTPIEATYAALNEQLRAQNRASCVVSGVNPIGFTAAASYLEVACADGAPGWVLEYDRWKASPKTLLNCAQARNIGGGCKLPTNRQG